MSSLNPEETNVGTNKTKMEEAPEQPKECVEKQDDPVKLATETTLKCGRGKRSLIPRFTQVKRTVATPSELDLAKTKSSCDKLQRSEQKKSEKSACDQVKGSYKIHVVPCQEGKADPVNRTKHSTGDPSESNLKSSSSPVKRTIKSIFSPGKRGTKTPDGSEESGVKSPGNLVKRTADSTKRTVKSPSNQEKGSVKSPSNQEKGSVKSPSNSEKGSVKSPSNSEKGSLKSPCDTRERTVKSPSHPVKGTIKSPSDTFKRTIHSPVGLVKCKVKSPCVSSNINKATLNVSSKRNVKTFSNKGTDAKVKTNTKSPGETSKQIEKPPGNEPVKVIQEKGTKESPNGTLQENIEKKSGGKKEEEKGKGNKIPPAQLKEIVQTVGKQLKKTEKQKDEPVGWQRFIDFNFYTYKQTTRNPNELLSKERVKILQARGLQKLLDVETTILLDILVSNQVITQAQLDSIRSQRKVENKVGTLLEILRKKRNIDYDGFCEALDQTGQHGIVYDIFLTPDDLDVAREKLMSFLQTHYTDLNLYTTSKEDHPVPLAKLYVNLNWDLKKRRQDSNTEPPKIPDLEQYLSELQESLNTRCVVTGEPGAGKTTCVKRISQIWLENYSPVNRNNFLLSSFLLVIPIVLRLVQYKAPLLEILKSQLTTLTALDIHAIVKCMEIVPSKVLLLLDGYDELRHKETIHNILRQTDYPKVKVIVTTRPHGITLLKQLGSKALQEIAGILGFNEEQKFEYIIMYYSLRGDVPKGHRLLEYLKYQKPELLSLARIPIRLEMMCIVWESREDLGELVVDLYVRFVQHLLDHLERKRGLAPYNRTPEREILIKYGPLLMQLAELAYNDGRMNAVFTYKCLCEHLRVYLGDAIDLGCLVKYNPSSNLEHSDWQFTHLSIQEYFMAFYLANTGNENVTYYITKCSTIEKFEKQQNAIQFLSGLNPDRANQIVTDIVKKMTDEDSCKRLLGILRDLVPCYRYREQVDFPLPSVVDATDEHDSDECLFSNDVNYRNLKTLSVKDVTKNMYRNNIRYIENLIVKDHSENVLDNDEMKSVAEGMKAVTSISVDSKFNDYSPLLEGLEKANIKYIKVEKIQGLLNIQSLAEFNQLEILEIADPETTSDTIDDICNSVKDIETLVGLSLHTLGFPEVLLGLDNCLKLSVVARGANEKNIKQFTDLMKENSTTPNINLLDLTNNKLTASGREISELVVNLPHMQKLNMTHCDIGKKTLENMADVMSKENKQLNLKQLILRDNQLQGTGEHLAVLLQHTKLLETLDLYGTNLTSDDITKITADKTECDLNKLCLNTDWIESEKLIDLFRISASYKVLALYNPSFIKSWVDVEACMSCASLANLTVLYLNGYNFSISRLLTDLANHLPSSLQALGLVKCRMSYIRELLYLISRMPPTLTYMNVSQNHYGNNILAIPAVKEHMSHLEKLNIGHPDDLDNEDIVTALKEELVQDLPELQVYCNIEEDIWQMHK